MDNYRNRRSEQDCTGTLHPSWFWSRVPLSTPCTLKDQERRLCHTSCHHQSQQKQDSALSTHSEQLLGLSAAWPCQVSYNSLIRELRIRHAVKLRCWPGSVYLLAECDSGAFLGR